MGVVGLPIAPDRRRDVAVRDLEEAMDVRVEQALAEDKPVVQNLMQPYQYEFSGFDGPCEYRDVNCHGLFRYDHLDHYWSEPGRLAFLIWVDDKLAGFALINQDSPLLSSYRQPAWMMAEFFVMRRYQRKGVGEKAARLIFDSLPGTWVVAELDVNINAQRFWRKVIGRYTGGNHKEDVLDNDCWCGPVQSFVVAHGVASNLGVVSPKEKAALHRSERSGCGVP